MVEDAHADVTELLHDHRDQLDSLAQRAARGRDARRGRRLRRRRRADAARRPSRAESPSRARACHARAGARQPGVDGATAVLGALMQMQKYFLGKFARSLTLAAFVTGGRSFPDLVAPPAEDARGAGVRGGAARRPAAQGRQRAVHRAPDRGRARCCIEAGAARRRDRRRRPTRHDREGQHRRGRASPAVRHRVPPRWWRPSPRTSHPRLRHAQGRAPPPGRGRRARGADWCSPPTRSRRSASSRSIDRAARRRPRPGRGSGG